ncbi:MAG: replicative DNA helicase [Myxococcota bacterium]
MSSRPYPHSLEAERALLGGLLQDPVQMDQVADLLQPDDFYRPDHADLFLLLTEMAAQNKAIDMVTLPRRLDAEGRPERYGGIEYVLELPSHAPSTANLDHYAKTIRELATMRQLISTTEDVARRAYGAPDGPGLLVEQAIKELAALGQGVRAETWGQISLLIDEEVNNLQSLQEAGETVVGVTTGFDELDQKLTGLRAGQLIILAARPGMGKTSLVLNIAQNAALRGGVGVGVFSLEMTRSELVGRMMTAEAEVHANNMRTGTLSDDDWKRVLLASESLRGTQVFIDDTPALTIGDLRARARKLKADTPSLQLIVVDYLQLMRGDDPRAPRIQQVGDISRGLKALAKDLELPVVALSQLNRGVESRQDKRPMLSDLRESGAIEQDADVILFIYRDDYYNPDSTEPGVAEVIIAKQRAGSTGSVKLAFMGQYTKFNNLASGGPLT